MMTNKTEMESTGAEDQSEFVTIKKKHVMAVAGLLVISLFFVFAIQGVIASTPTGNAVAKNQGAAAPSVPVQGGKQIVKITIQGSSYQPNPVRVKKGIPVEFQVDTNSVFGCYRGIQIPAFNVRKVVTPEDNLIDFTPDKAGTFGMSCFMGMGRGQLIVEDEAGNVPSTNTVAQDTPAGSCGSGGCGCGTR